MSVYATALQVSLRKPGNARPRATHLDAMAFIRRCLHHVLPDGFMKVCHFGFLHASCPMHAATLRLLILQAHPSLRHTTHTLPGCNILEDTLNGRRGFLEHRSEATSRVASLLMS